ncbi:MAG: adenylosuccinate synthetase [Candidatus Pacebacteria bacterium]|jgi:adenylosuccinate synthase|nr:adenylosuccinate synthetase [Candidatus Paceibacterota bacterium]
MKNLDIIVDLQYGDCGKGKVAHYLCEKNKYTHVVRYNGGANAGHTIYHKGKKVVTHQIPVGVMFGIKSVIGPGCVVDPELLEKEILELKAVGININKKLFVANNTHIVTKAHKDEDAKDAKIGTTKKGIGFAYRDKYVRLGKRAEDTAELKPYTIDFYKEVVNKPNSMVLMEGAQGFGLDIDWGDYPYVTSSSCTSAGALLNGFNYSNVNSVWGVAKVYETYVGNKKFEPDQEVFKKIRELGQEYGATTGRPRQCNYFNLDTFKKAVKINGVTHIVISKMDILRELNEWKMIENGKVKNLKTEKAMKEKIIEEMKSFGIKKANIYFSEKKDTL